MECKKIFVPQQLGWEKGNKPDKIQNELKQAELAGRKGWFEIREEGTETKLGISPSHIYNPAFPLLLLSFIEGFI